jgi:ribose/xylose/arabinose/galactoside ABC-type transport system permease subunit
MDVKATNGASGQGTAPSDAGAPRDTGSTRPAIVRAATWLATRRLSGLVAAIIVTMILFYALNRYFISTGNLLNLVRSASALAIIAFGQTLVLLTGEIDLSVGAIYGFSAMVSGQLMEGGTPVPLALLAGIAAGGTVGLVNGLITTKVGVNSFITTLGTLNFVMGLTYLISGNTSSNPPSDMAGYDLFELIGGVTLPGTKFPIQIVWMALIAVIMWIVMHRSLFGFRLAAIGGNPMAARVVRIPIARYKIAVFVISGVCAAFAGIMDFSFVGTTDPTGGTSLPFTVFAAVIIGGASLSGGRGTIVGTLVGALFLTMITNGLALNGVGAAGQLLMVGTIIIAAVAIDNLSTRRLGQGTQF